MLPVLLFITSTSSSPHSLPSPSPCVQWSVESSATSICLTSLSPSTVAAPALRPLSQNLPWSLLCPHSSHLVRACPPWSHKAPSPRPSPHSSHDSLDLTPPCTTCQSRCRYSLRRPLLFVDRRASRLDHLTHSPPPATSTQPRLLYPPYHVQSISSVCLQPKKVRVFSVSCARWSLVRTTPQFLDSNWTRRCLDPNGKNSNDGRGSDMSAFAAKLLPAKEEDGGIRNTEMRRNRFCVGQRVSM